MSKLKNLKKGSILSETSYYVVKQVNKTTLSLEDDFGNEIEIGNEYVDKILVSADHFELEEKKSMTELAEIFLGSPRIAMTVCFMKKDTAKTKKAYDAEVKAAIETVQNARVADVPGLLKDLIENPVSKVIPGEERIMKGRHYGQIDDLGRVQFVDMELPKTDSVGGIRQVDPRTIKYLIVNGVKYTLK